MPPPVSNVKHETLIGDGFIWKDNGDGLPGLDDIYTKNKNGQLALIDPAQDSELRETITEYCATHIREILQKTSNNGKEIWGLPKNVAELVRHFNPTIETLPNGFLTLSPKSGAVLPLPNGARLTEGRLCVDTKGQWFVLAGEAVVISGVKIEAKKEDYGSYPVAVFFDGKEHGLATYVSIHTNKKTLLLHGQNGPGMGPAGVVFEAGNPFLSIDSTENQWAKISTFGTGICKLEARDGKGLIPKMTMTGKTGAVYFENGPITYTFDRAKQMLFAHESYVDDYSHWADERAYRNPTAVECVSINNEGQAIMLSYSYGEVFSDTRVEQIGRSIILDAYGRSAVRQDASEQGEIVKTSFAVVANTLDQNRQWTVQDFEKQYPTIKLEGELKSADIQFAIDLCEALPAEKRPKKLEFLSYEELIKANRDILTRILLDRKRLKTDGMALSFIEETNKAGTVASKFKNTDEVVEEYSKYSRFIGRSFSDQKIQFTRMGFLSRIALGIHEAAHIETSKQIKGALSDAKKVFHLLTSAAPTAENRQKAVGILEKNFILQWQIVARNGEERSPYNRHAEYWEVSSYGKLRNVPRAGYMGPQANDNIHEDISGLAEARFLPKWIGPYLNPTHAHYDSRFGAKLGLLCKFGYLTKDEYLEVYRQAGVQAPSFQEIEKEMQKRAGIEMKRLLKLDLVKRLEALIELIEMFG